MGVLVTGAAGFIGAFTTHRLLEQGETVVGLDNLNDYYDPKLKVARIDRINDSDTVGRFKFIKTDIADRQAMESIFKSNRIDRVVHLAAQAGVRYSIEDPYAYASSNLTGFLNILEGCRNYGIKHLVFASTSSVYGNDTSMPFSEHVGANHPLSFYAATKRSNELMAHAYANLFSIPCTGLRLFTVYGPWGRPDMALFLFTKAILEGKPIDIFNHGEHQRDFTYVDDVVSGIVEVLNHPAKPAAEFDHACPDPVISSAPWRVYNIGSGEPVSLMRLLDLLQAKLGRKADMNMLPMQAGDVLATWSDTSDLVRDFDFRATTSVEEGVSNFVDWYLEYHCVTQTH